MLGKFQKRSRGKHRNETCRDARQNVDEHRARHLTLFRDGDQEVADHGVVVGGNVDSQKKERNAEHAACRQRCSGRGNQNPEQTDRKDQQICQNRKSARADPARYGLGQFGAERSRSELKKREENRRPVAHSASAFERHDRNRRKHDVAEVEHRARVNLFAQGAVGERGAELRKKRFPRRVADGGGLVDPADKGRGGDSCERARRNDCGQNPDVVAPADDEGDCGEGDDAQNVEPRA